MPITKIHFLAIFTSGYVVVVNQIVVFFKINHHQKNKYSKKE